MVEGVVADMDFLGIESEKEIDFMKNGSNSKRIEGRAKNRAKMNVVVNGSAADNGMSDAYLDPRLSKYCREKESFSSELKVGMAFEEQRNEEKSLHSSSKSDGRSKLAVSGFIPRLDLSVARSGTSNPIDLFPDQSGFGSPIELMGDFDHRTSSEQDGFLRHGTSFRPPQGKESGAQLTIFYRGTVNLYNDIPADKAQDIMLIASSGNHSSYLHTKVQNDCEPQTEQKTCLPVLKLSEGLEIHREHVSRNQHTDVPQMRRHSLQRFLEKRKERIYANAKCPYTTAEAINTEPPQHPSSSSSPMSVHSDSHS